MTNNRQQTPLEKLISDKERIREQCRTQEQKLNDSFAYMQENAGSLLLSGISFLLFPKSKQTQQPDEETISDPEQAGLPATSLGLADYLSIAKSMTPLLWEIVQPFIITWGIKKAKNLLLSAFSKKKK